MKHKCRWMAGILSLMMVVGSGINTVEAAGLGGLLKKIPGVSTSSGSKKPAIQTAKTTRTPEKLSNGQQMVTNDLRVSTMLKGKLLLHGKPAKEYVTIYICPTTVTLKGNTFVGGYYGKTLTDTKGEFYVRAQPGTYKIYVQMSETWGVWSDISTDNHGVTYEVKDLGFKPAWIFKELS